MMNRDMVASYVHSHTLSLIAENWKLQLQSIDIGGVNGKGIGRNE